MRLDQAFSDSFTRFPDSPAIIEGNRACTYSQLHARVERLAGALASRGVSSGGHVVYVSANSAVFAELTLACSRIGAVCEIHNIRLSDQTLLELIARSGASLAVLSADAWDRLGPHLPSSGSIETTVVFGYEEDLLDDAIPYEEFLEGAPAPPNQKPADDEDPVLMMFTSGTTGTPKGVLFSHRAIANRIAIDVESMGFSSGDSMLFVLPFFHTTCMSVFAVLSAGGTAVIGNSSDPRSIMETVNRYGITRIGLVPYHMRSLCSYVEEHGLTADTLELIIYGAEPASPDLIERCRDLLGCKLLQGYGMTEMASTVTILTPEDHEKRELLSTVGRPVPRTQVRIVNDEGVALPGRSGGRNTGEEPLCHERILEERRRIARGHARWVVLDAGHGLCGFGRIPDALGQEKRPGGERRRKRLSLGGRLLHRVDGILHRRRRGDGSAGRALG